MWITLLLFAVQGTLVFDFWTMVVYLLQADDLEVKEVMASVTAEPSLSQRGK